MRRILLSIALLLSMTGCATQYGVLAPAAAPHPHVRMATGPQSPEALPGLRVQTRDGASLLFAENHWRLTLEGIDGSATVTTEDGMQYAADTTLSYWDASSAAATGRNSTMSQFLLTILGVILVLGLAAIILYAAFLATAR
jgi:hypothetical protein